MFFATLISMRLTPAALLLCAALHAGAVRIEISGDASRYWPQWRGPTGQGLALSHNFPDRWSDTGNVLWKVELLQAAMPAPLNQGKLPALANTSRIHQIANRKRNWPPQREENHAQASTSESNFCPCV
jgi:hypothetical protein